MGPALCWQDTGCRRDDIRPSGLCEQHNLGQLSSFPAVWVNSALGPASSPAGSPTLACPSTSPHTWAASLQGHLSFRPETRPPLWPPLQSLMGPRGPPDLVGLNLSPPAPFACEWRSLCGGPAGALACGTTSPSLPQCAGCLLWGTALPPILPPTHSLEPQFVPHVPGVEAAG